MSVGSEWSRNLAGYPNGSGCICRTESDLSKLMRGLFEEHVAWTRMTILSIAFGLPDEQVVTARLLRNADDMGTAFSAFYGEEIGNQMAALIRDHLAIAAQLVKAAKAGDSAGAADAEARWYANADAIVAFLNAINPYWTREAMTQMWYEHLSLTKAEAVAILNGDYAAGIARYDEIEKQIRSMADALTEGIVRQFPDVFTC